MDIGEIKFDEKGLVAAIVQDINTKKVLMLAYMNKEALEKTLEEEVVHFYSRSRQELWKKGETSGNIQKLRGLSYDCDGDALLVMVDQLGVACHTGTYSCFFNEIINNEESQEDKSTDANILENLYWLLEERKKNPIEGSYSNYLFEKGIDKILKKIGEESAEVIIASKNQDKKEIIYEISDLVYHTLVLMVEQGIKIDDIKMELMNRRK